MASPEELFARFRRQADAPALAAVFDAVAPELLLVASHLATAPTGAEDLVQATFLDAIEKADRWDAARPLMPWLIGILVNHARLERRRQQRPLDAARLPQPGEPSPLDAVAASEVAEQVAAALRSLPRQFRQTLTLRLVHGLSPTEIAHALGCPVATVKTRLQRGMDWLRKLLPAGIAVGLAGMVTAGRGLAAVRTAVLAHGKTLVPVAATGVALGVVGAIGGGVVMKKLVLAACVIVCLASLWFVVPRPDELALAGGGTPAPASSPQTAMLVAAAKEPTVSGAAPNERVAAPANAAATSGSADLEFVWKGLGAPASGLRVSCDATADDGSAPTSLHADERGRLRLVDLRAGDYRLVGFFRPNRVITIRAGEETRERIEVEPGLRVDGTVVDGDGRGVAGAAVLVQYFADSTDREPRLVAVARDDGTFQGATDFGGWFWAQKPGFTPSACRLETVEGELQLRLVLAAGGTMLRGTAFTSEHGRAADARVTIVRTTPRDQCSAPIVLRTDANGAFATTELGAGEHLLVVQASGHAATPVAFAVTPGQAQSLDVQLTGGATVFGTIHGADGKPVRAALEARPAWAGARAAWVEALRPLYNFCVVRAVGGADGSYRIENVPADAVTLATSAYGDAIDQQRELVLQEGAAQRCDFVLGGGGEIRGRVVDADDRPQANWTVHVSPVRNGNGHTVTTDAQGAFSAGGLDGPEYRLTATPMVVDTHLPWASATNVRPGAGEVVLRVRHTADDAGWFTGSLLDAGGAAPTRVVSAWITPVGEVQGSQCQVKMRDGGRFELGPLPPGSYHVLVRIPDQGGVQFGPHDLPPRGRVDLGAARVPAPGILELRFATADGRTVAPTEISAWDKAGNGGAVFERGADGIFRSKPVPAGIYRVFAWGEDFARLDQPAVVAAERATLTELQVIAATPVRFAVSATRSSRVQLEILDAAGKTVASPMLSVDTATEFTWSRGLPRGTYSFEANAWPDGEPVRGSFIVSGESAAQRVEVKLPPGR